jgi:hypothetical protein
VRAPLTFDVATMRAYGPAMPAIRRTLTRWAAIDWFAPRAAASSRSEAVQLFAEHRQRAGRYAPELFPSHVLVESKSGSLDDFHALSLNVQASASDWDWKYSALKKISKLHADACGWSDDALASFAADIEKGERPLPGDLWFRHSGGVIWDTLRTPDDFSPGLAAEHGAAPESAAVKNLRWYHSYALFDLFEALRWQLAEKSDATTSNPFVPLLDCYAAGHYPFSLGRETAVLFAFDRRPPRSQ